MRPIEFRQRNKNNGQFHLWGLVEGGWVNPLDQDNYVKPEESNQFTGLLDKNGSQIYEGDVLSLSIYTGGRWRSEDSVYRKHRNTKRIVVFQEPKFVMKVTREELVGNEYKDYKNYEDFYDLSQELYEVIGNIYSNCELTLA